MYKECVTDGCIMGQFREFAPSQKTELVLCRWSIRVGQLVILKLGTGSFDQGFPVTLQIGTEQARPTIELTGTIPPAPAVIQAYWQWQTIYRQLDWSGRPIGLPKQPQPPATVAQCQVAANHLRDCFNTWLQAESLRPIREKWLEKLQPTDTIRIILQASDDRLQKLPWHLWDLVERYPHAEIAFSAPAYEQPPRSARKPSRVRILAILGNSAGIDTQADRALLEQLPDAQVTFLIEPQREALTAHLWKQPWDIFFFAGHSMSHADQGYIAINPHEKITLGELKYALRQAVSQGLKLAIFNSCDGLGLAHEFAELQIPQLIVMREPVPDRVAQKFLQYFLTAFSQHQPLYLAVRSAREQLQGLEAQFPCATWLPVIFQNPAETPPTWPQLLGRITQPTLWQPLSIAQRGLTLLLGLTLAATTLAIRHTGLLQPLELGLYDQMLRLRPQEPPDDRLLVITVTEADVQAQPQRRGSLADRSLAQLLTKLARAQPRAIGLDIYRDFPVEANLPQLAQQLRQNSRFIAVCRTASEVNQVPEIPPPPEVPVAQLGFSNFVLDPDRVLRRQLLALQPPANAKCATDYAFSTMLALRYLADDQMSLQFNQDGAWRIGQAVFTPLQSYQGGYQGIDAWGHQILLNYRNYRSPAAVAPRITLAEALNPAWDAAIAKGRIVLIGTTAESFQDVSLTPFQAPTGERLLIPGVMMQAQMVSQLLSAVLDQRPLITTWPAGGEVIWIVVWGLVGGAIGNFRRPIHLVLAVIGAIMIVIGVGYSGMIVATVWLPVVPAGLAVVMASAVVFWGMPVWRRSSRSL
jgi:CHASE2 domain-containing sensor protein